MTSDNGFSVKIETVTPTQAKALLDTSKNLRRLNNRHVNMLARDISSDRFAVNGAAIVLDHKNRLVDGQHRLAACVLADKPIKTVVMRGVDNALTLDVGRRRQLYHLMQAQGWRNPHATASAVRTCLLYQRGVDPFTDKQKGELTLTELVTALRSMRRKDLEEASAIAYRNNGVKKMVAPGTYISFLYLAMQIDKTRALDFSDSFQKAEMLRASDPIYVLRRFFQNADRKVFGGILGRRIAFGVLVKTWNAIVGGYKIDKLALRDEEQLPRLESGKETE